MKTIQKFKGKINPRLYMTTSSLCEIKNASTSTFGLIHNSFIFGYAQGYKAKAAELKKGARA